MLSQALEKKSKMALFSLASCKTKQWVVATTQAKLQTNHRRTPLCFVSFEKESNKKQKCPCNDEKKWYSFVHFLLSFCV
jgi:hypothetical protein